MAVALTGAADPDIAGAIDGQPLIRFRPFVSLARTAPVARETAVRREYENVRRRHAAFARRRRLRSADLGAPVEAVAVLLRRIRLRAVEDIYVVARIDRHPDGGADQPAVRQRLRPERIDLEDRRL